MANWLSKIAAAFSRTEDPVIETMQAERESVVAPAPVAVAQPIAAPAPVALSITRDTWNYDLGPSPHFTWTETMVTSTGLANQWPESMRPAIISTAWKMEEVRDALDGHAITVNSWYRGPAVNKAVGGVAKSAHQDGEAVDFTCAGFGNVRAVCLRLKERGVKMDQLIQEGAGGGMWVHIGNSKTQRQQYLTMRSGQYFTGIL